MAEVVQAEPQPKKKSGSKSHASKLVSLLTQSGADLFHSPEGDPYVTVDGETMSLTGQDFKRWLSREYIRATKKVPSGSALADAINGIAGSAVFKGPEHHVFTRVAAVDGAVYLDLGSKAHGVVEVTPHGWKVLASADVRFIRRRGLLALPIPVRCERPLSDMFKTFINVRDRHDMMLVIAWALAALRGKKPYPILSINGEQGSAKSSASRFLRRIVDPNIADTKLVPREARDVMIAARNSYVIAYENLTRIDDWLADALCCLSTGAGYGTRALTTDTDEILTNAARPILLNGINDVLKRQDLLDRTIVITLDPILDTKRLTESEVEAKFRQAHPEILGGLLAAVSCALRNEGTTRPTRLPRMADFAITVTAAGPALGWDDGEFLKVYGVNRRAAVDAILDGNLVVTALQTLTMPWTGTAQELRVALTSDKHRDLEYWPRTPKAMANRLRELAPGLRQMGIDVRFTKQAHGIRQIEIRKADLASQELLDF